MILLDKLKACLNAIMNIAKEPPKTLQQSNVVNAIVMETINIAIHIDPESELVEQASYILVRYISARETNMRYLGLEMMARFSNVGHCLYVIKRNHDAISFMLTDKDVSVRKRAIDVLYNICDNTNCKRIVDDLMATIPNSDYSIREELVLKIAILTEKFSTEPQWYVDVIFKLIGLAGDHVSNEVWYRAVQVVTNNSDLHHYAAQQIFELLKSPTCHENAVKIGAYLLGEYGDLIVNEPGCSPTQQLFQLRNKYKICSLATRAILLSTFGKFVNLFPEIKGEAQSILRSQEAVLDAEIQQRACEYLQLTSLPSDDLLQAVFEQMPPFPARESALIVRLRKQAKDGDEGKSAPELTQRAVVPKGGGIVPADKAAFIPSESSSAVSSTQPSASAAPPTGTVDLLGLDIVSPTPTTPTSNSMPTVQEEKLDGWLKTLLLQPAGVLYEDATLQIGLKSEYRGSQGRLALYFGNKTSSALTNFSIGVRFVEGLLVISTTNVTEVGPLSQLPYMFNVECIAPFASMPLIAVTFTGSSMPLLKLPLLLSKFSQGMPMGGPDFLSRWKNLGTSAKEVQHVFRGTNQTPATTIRTTLESMNWSIVDNVDPNPINFVCATVLLVQNGTKVGSLLRLECNPDGLVCVSVSRGRFRESSSSFCRCIVRPFAPPTTWLPNT